MDQLIKELVDLKKVLEDALEDGRIRPLEAVRIAKEVADILQLVADVIFRVTDAEQKSHQ
ncbi:MAG TPA: hypothetical protein PLK04_10230 [Bacillota bacterium]|nr:hypothetical protein [Bacillota bacterium]HPZ14599.1 hypothetical protein [Bacillota bacterium]